MPGKSRSQRKRVVFLGESGFSVLLQPQRNPPRLILLRHKKLWNSSIGGLPV